MYHEHYPLSAKAPSSRSTLIIIRLICEDLSHYNQPRTHGPNCLWISCCWKLLKYVQSLERCKTKSLQKKCGVLINKLVCLIAILIFPHRNLQNDIKRSMKKSRWLSFQLLIQLPLFPSDFFGKCFQSRKFSRFLR